MCSGFSYTSKQFYFEINNNDTYSFTNKVVHLDAELVSDLTVGEADGHMTHNDVYAISWLH